MWKSKQKWEGKINIALLMINEIRRRNCLHQPLKGNTRASALWYSAVLSCYSVSASTRSQERERGCKQIVREAEKGEEKNEKESEEELEKSKKTSWQGWGQGKEMKKINLPSKYVFMYKLYAFLFIKIWSNAWSSIVVVFVQCITQYIPMLMFLPCYTELDIYWSSDDSGESIRQAWVSYCFRRWLILSRLSPERSWLSALKGFINL